MAAAAQLHAQPAAESSGCIPVASDEASWAHTPVAARVKVLTRARHLLAEHADDLVQAVSPALSRTHADTLAAEVLPLLAACQFLERNAVRLLKPRRLGRRGLPFWLSGVDTVIQRAPFGRVLILAPYNYPLFLPGVQVLQALVAGNSATWKPGRGGVPVARLVATLLEQSGLASNVLHVTGESVEDGQAALAAMPGKIIFTGSAAAGRKVAHSAAEHAIPMVAELSGCDAVFALPTADQERLSDALTFGLRLNGSATCMAPRRLFLIGGGHAELLRLLKDKLQQLPAVEISADTAKRLQQLTQQAVAEGAEIIGTQDRESVTPHLILNAQPSMQITREDLFAPVLSVIRCADVDAALQANSLCPTGLTASIFGNAAEAQQLAAKLDAGTVMINDLIVPTADPRVPFGGRRASGYGVTRGAEGLLEMTAPKVVSVRNSKDRRHYQATDFRHAQLFHAVIQLTHGQGLRTRVNGLRAVITAAKKLEQKSSATVKDLS